MKTRYCHKDFGLTCINNIGGKCIGGSLLGCEHQSLTPKYSGPTIPPMPRVMPPKRKSTDCDLCIHHDVCVLKDTFNKIKEDHYPLVCECEKYERIS